MSKPQILLVEDEPEILTMVTRILGHAGWAVSAAGDAKGGLALLGQQRFDLLVTDKFLPGIDGLSLIREARKLQPEIPTIMITAHTTWQGREEADELRVSAWVSKPFAPSTLLAACRKALGLNAPAASGD